MPRCHDESADKSHQPRIKPGALRRVSLASMAVGRPRASGTTRHPPLRRNGVKRALGLTLDEKQSYRNYLWRADGSPEACLWDSQPSSPIRRTSLREAARVRLSEG